MRSIDQNKNQRNPQSQSRPRTPLNTYYRGQPLANEPNSPFKRRAPKRRVRGYVYGVADIVLVAILLITLIYSLIVSPNPVVKANDQTFHKLHDYQTAAAEQLSHIGNRNKVTFSQTKLSAALIKQFPEIRAVQVELPLFSEQPKINLTIDGASLFLDSQGSRYIVDASGKAVAKAADLPKVKGLPVVNDTSGYHVTQGQQILSSDTIGFIKTVIAETKLTKVYVTALTLPPVSQELDVKADGQPYYVKFFMGGDPLIQTGQYLAARHHFSQSGGQPSQYLDVRVPGKVYYK